MSHYLERLVAQSRGELPTVQPRLPGRFEPVAGQNMANPDAASHNAEVITANDTGMPRHSPVQSGEPVATGLAHTTLFSDALFEQRRANLSGSDTPRDVLSPAASPTRRSSPHGENVEASAGATDRGNAYPAQASPAHHAMPGAPGEMAQLVAPPSPMASLAPDMPLPPRPQPARATSEPAHRTEQNETVVHVTIGRVDVRAITPTAPKPTPHREPPRRSLDDYLRGTTRR